MSFFSGMLNKPSSSSKKTKTEKAYEKLNFRSASAQSQLIYPIGLLDDKHSSGQYVLFNVNTVQGSHFKSNASKRVENERTTSYGTAISSGESSSLRKIGMTNIYKRTIDSMILHMPENVYTNYGVRWEAGDIGTISKIIQAVSHMDQLRSSDLKEAIKQSAKNTVAGVVQAVTPLNAKDALEFSTGIVSNPMTEMLFKGVTNREVPMRFKFNPRNEQESIIAREIIRRFKFHMHPEFKYGRKSTSYYLYPSTFDITFMKKDGENVWLNRFSTCALTNMNIDHASSGKYKTFGDNDAPVEFTLELNFMELEQLHKDRFDDPNASF